MVVKTALLPAFCYAIAALPANGQSMLSRIGSGIAADESQWSTLQLSSQLVQEASRVTHSIKGEPLSTNPTHYGPPSSDGGSCMGDEEGKMAFLQQVLYTGRGTHPNTDPVFCGKKCSHDSDCPTDKPAEARGRTHCHEFVSQNYCVIKCQSDDDCPAGALCFKSAPGYKFGAFCSYDPPLDCYNIQKITGNWEQIGSSPGPSTITITVGCTQSTSVTDTHTWGRKVAWKGKDGFKSTSGGSGEAEVSGEISDSITQSYESTFSMSTTQSYATTVPAGVVWQWIFRITDPCSSPTAAKGDFVVTPSNIQPPCCLPGYFADVKDAMGKCLAGPRLCDDSELVCPRQIIVTSRALVEARRHPDNGPPIKADHLDIFTQIVVGDFGRPIYENTKSQFLIDAKFYRDFYVHEKTDPYYPKTGWLVSSSAAAEVWFYSPEEVKCPTLASKWYAWDGEAWRAAALIVSEATCAYYNCASGVKKDGVGALTDPTEEKCCQEPEPNFFNTLLGKVTGVVIVVALSVVSALVVRRCRNSTARSPKSLQRLLLS